MSSLQKDRGNAPSRGQVVRVGIGVAVLSLAAAIYVPHVTHTISTDAIINARAIAIVSPIEGMVTMAPPADGMRVSAGAILAEVENRAVDRAHFHELQAEAGVLRERVAAQRQLLDDFIDLRRSLEETRNRYQTARAQRLENLIAEAGAEAQAAEASAREQLSDLERKRILHERGTISAAAIEAVQARATRTQAEADRTRLAIRRMRDELQSVRQGVFVSEERNDVPYTQQRIDEIAIKQVEIAAQIREQQTRIAEVERVLGVERERLKERALVQLAAPRDGIVWRPQVVRGSRVAPSGEVMTLIDCSELFVNVKIRGRHFEAIRPGDEAQVRVVGSDILQVARVRDLRAMATADRSDRFAAALPEVHGDEVLVTLHLDRDSNQGIAGQYCNVGRGVEVKFMRDLGVVDRMATRVASLFGADPATMAAGVMPAAGPVTMPPTARAEDVR
jgi:multidrug resistance efflux pump